MVGLELNRSDFYEKELSFQVSCSYGPGRYDPEYEEKGHDYPVGFVRWTEQRNFETVLDMLAAGHLEVKPLITHRFAINGAYKAYDLLVSRSEPYLGILLEYESDRVDTTRTVRLASPSTAVQDRQSPSLSVIGADNYAGRVLIVASGHHHSMDLGVGNQDIDIRGRLLKAVLAAVAGFWCTGASRRGSRPAE